MTDTERSDLLAVLDKHRGFLRFTAKGLSESQARETPTASALSVGGLVKHVTATEKQWADFIVNGASRTKFEDVDYSAYARGFELGDDETLEGALAAYDVVAAATDQLVGTVDLDEAHDLPDAPWFTDRSWTNRRALQHILAETAQHAGHADIIRETLDGQKTMG